MILLSTLNKISYDLFSFAQKLIMKFCCRLCIKFGSEDLRVIKIHTVACECVFRNYHVKIWKKSQDDNFYLKNLRKANC